MALEGWVFQRNIFNQSSNSYTLCEESSVVLLKAEMIQARVHAPLTSAHRAAAVDTRNGSQRAGAGEYDDTSHLTALLKRQLVLIVVHYLFCQIL